ncbi:Endoplasmic reticulum junction formation protein lunapark [Thalictrum thalictroides]|uniref:Endoplasmic reticulum junction formation protein lunapark n=1 Tax=Thalictrum thalictroides TaxID=46969 RepID=A0A7J6VDR8_THATH|nr:Endoplasmic reticulum junction formation protein lunapark [Thalictrum thalictroides]
MAANHQPLDTIEEDNSNQNQKQKQKRKPGIISRFFNAIFRIGGRDDFEKRLQHISKEEASVLARMKRRSRNCRTMARNLILLSLLLEVIAVGYAIMTTRSLDLNWKMRAVRVLPMFLLPALSSIIYFTLMSFIRMCDRKDQKTLERLREERQTKINELKERTNYYITQQLIQRYDPDPAAKAAAASVLASKLGADSGLKVYLGEESTLNPPIGKSNDTEFVQSKGLRNRKPSHSRSSSTGSLVLPQTMEEDPSDVGFDSAGSPESQTVVVDHHPRSTVHDGGWIARVAALLVGEDPTQSYALICGSCHRHNGLARKEDFPYITYYCPQCNALNRSRQLEEHPPITRPPSVSSSESPNNDDAVNPVTEDKILNTNSRPAVDGAPFEDKVSEEPVD